MGLPQPGFEQGQGTSNLHTLISVLHSDRLDPRGLANLLCTEYPIHFSHSIFSSLSDSFLLSLIDLYFKETRTNSNVPDLLTV
jgi:hypothetical protein